MLEQSAQRAGSGNPLRERQPQRCSSFLQFEAFRINSDAAPIAVRSAKQPGGIKPASVGMISIHVRDRINLRLDERPRIGNISPYILRLEVHNAAEAGDEMRASDLHPIEPEVRKAREHFGLRVAS